MRQKLLSTLIGVGSIGCGEPLLADQWSLAAGLGTTGIGGNVSWRFSEHFALTAGYSGFTYDGLDREINDVEYRGDVDADIYSLKLDIYPSPDSGFFLSAGLVRPDIQITAIGRLGLPTWVPDSVTLDDGRVIDINELASVDARGEVSDNLEPYLGIGWRSSARQGFGFYAEAGAFWVDPDVSLSPRASTGDPRGDALLRRYVEAEEADVRDEIDKYDVYPVVVLGVQYTF
ncbi:hypothetical protein [Salinicola avicenniae]|uniref:hypothetical protein n=1 Tax=Salinicola avicenniae TaxID=2916836 RepID=UPI0020749477|nr:MULTISPECIES: hypothetical protein [unclassified Salinicola]